MYIEKYWGNYIGGTDDSLNLVAFLEDQKKEEISLTEIFSKIGLDKQNWDFRQTIEYLEFTHSNGVDMDFHFAIDVITDLAAILLECYVNGSVNLHDLDEYNTPSRCIRITATPEEHNAMDRTLADFAQNPLSYDLHEMMDDEEIQEMARDVEALRKELYESAGRNRNYYVKAEDMKNLLPDWDGANGCIATNRITVEGCKVGYCYREKPDGDWDSGWRFTAGDESDAYMDDPNNSGIYGLNTICNDDPDIFSLLNAPYNSAFERDENNVFHQIADWEVSQSEEGKHMDLLQQCQKWLEDEEYQKIKDTLEAIPIEERTPEIDSELARAYIAGADVAERESFEKALELLAPHEAYFADDHCWNYRIASAYYYLDQEGLALRYFEKALKARPGDEDTQEYIDDCRRRLSLPRFSKNFRERTEAAWEKFAEQESQLRQIMDTDKNQERGEELVAKCEEILHIAFEDISFEMGFNGEKHELILTPEGDKVKLFELVYFQKHTPKEILEHWNILVGRQSVENIGLRADEWYISGEDVQIWLEEVGENRFALETYCEKLLPILAEEEGRVWWMLTTLTDQVLGEIPHMRYIEAFDVLTEPKEEPAQLLSRLPNILKEKGLDLSADPESYLETYIGYSMEHNEDPDADWRMDTIAGSTCCAAFINGYLNNDNDYMDDLHADGAVAGFFCYPLDTLREEEGSQKIFDFRDQLEGVFTTDEGMEVLTLTGGATGIYYGYVDFIAWDIRTALQMAKEFFADTDLPWASFHTFRREASTVYLKQTENDDPDTTESADELEETLTGMDYIPYTPENAEAFYQQLEQWNDDDEFTHCVQAMNIIPEEWWDYRLSYALARALENYAILGDHQEGTPNYKGDKALLRAIDVLESVREEGQNKAEWNMRMAYAYQYLYGQEEKAIPYAQRWAELDPEDTDAPLVIQECQKEIAKRAEEEADEENDGDHKGVFTGFVLLSKGKWDKQQFIQDMKEKWNITVDEHDASEDKSDDALVFEVGDMLAAVSLGTYPIPNGEAEINAENNYMWDDAVKIAKEHRAHIMVAVLGKEEDLLEKGKLYTKLVAACCRQKYATGIYTSGVVFEPRFYEGFAVMMHDDELPIFNWIWFGLYRDENGMNAYTYGMDVFGKDEMEVLGTDAEPGDLRDFLASLASYVLENDVELHDGETIGFSAEDKHTITRSPGISLPEDQMTLKISWKSTDNDPDDEVFQEKDFVQTEVYTEDEMRAIESHIQQYFGKFENVLHELVSTDIHVDICVVPPSAERDYYTLVTMGMGAHRMNVPEELAEYKLERAELAIALSKDWKIKKETFEDEKCYWPIRLLKILARLPIASDTWLGFGHTMDHEENFAENTKLCAAILAGSQGTEDGSEVCILPNGEEVNFYQVIPLYRDELEYKLSNDADALLDKMDGISFVVNPSRQNAITRGTLGSVEDGDGIDEMDDAVWHLETIQEKNLPVDEINAYNHMAIYLRWCMEHDLMSVEFMERYWEQMQSFMADLSHADLRGFIRDQLKGKLFGALFNKVGLAFASYYYGESDSPYFPNDIDNYAIGIIGQERNYSDEIQDEAYLFIPFDEEYYQAMAKVIEKRFMNWQGQDFNEDTLEPSELACAMMKYLDCECTYFPAMKDDDPIMAAYSYAKRDSVRDGYIPVLVKVDEILWECLIMNSDPDSDGEDNYAFDPDKVAEYRKQMLAAPLKDGKAVLEEMIGLRKEEGDDDDMDWEEEILGKMENGYENNRFSSYWEYDTDMTYPLILAKIPVKHPWEIFAYLPFGNWNECPDTPELMAVAKYWFEQYGALPAAMTHDELEFDLPTAISKEKAMDLALEQYGFCPDVVDQGPEGTTVGSLADVLWQSKVWYSWWD